jgi:hypothetical protein
VGEVASDDPVMGPVSEDPERRSRLSLDCALVLVMKM